MARVQMPKIHDTAAETSPVVTVLVFRRALTLSSKHKPPTDAGKVVVQIILEGHRHEHGDASRNTRYFGLTFRRAEASL